MIIKLREIPPEGTVIEGEEPGDVFNLDEDAIRPSGLVHYRFQASIQEGNLLLTGAIEAPFELRCVRCLEFHQKTVRLDPYDLFEPTENRISMDLTERVREDILLDLPGYPRCEEADTPRKCQPPARFGREGDFKPLDDEIADDPRKTDVWSALDDLQQPKDDASNQ
jgi:uncharacterized protein